MQIKTGVDSSTGRNSVELVLTTEADIKPLLRRAGFDPDKYELTLATSDNDAWVTLKFVKKTRGIDFDRIRIGG